MPSLIRLLGDSDKNSSEVRNTFKEPIIIPAHAKVALTGMNAILVDDLATERFVISGTFGQFKIGIAQDTASPPTIQSANIPAATYSTASFVDAVETAANFTGTAANYLSILGLHHEIDLDTASADSLQIRSFQSAPADPTFTTATLWIARSGGAYKPAAATSSNGFTATATAASFTQLLNQERIPLVSSSVEATFVNGNTVALEITATSHTDPDVVIWGIRTNAGGYEYGYMDLGVPLWTPIVVGVSQVLAAANDVVKMYRYADSIVIDIKSSVGAVKAGITYSGILSREELNTSNVLIQWAYKAGTGGQFSSVLHTAIIGTDNPPSALTGLNDTINCYLKFEMVSGAFNSILASYCGFPGERNRIAYKGDPATLTSRAAVSGLPGSPGVLICLEGLGLLKSYDGAATAKSPVNIVYSLNELQDKSQYLQLDVPEPLYLDIGNPRPININELRVRMFEAGGYNQLQFIGNPSFSFIIDYPDQKPSM